MKIFHSHGSVLGGSLLISGTTIGVGMLALPVVTGPGGFWPSILIYLVCWAFLLATGLLLLEVCSWMPDDANLITMANRLLGRPGKYLCWVVYLFLFEMVMIAHVVGGGATTNEIFASSLGTVPATLLYVALFSPIVYLGTRVVDRLNTVIFSGVLITYFLFIFVALPHIEFEKLSYYNWTLAWPAIPVLFTAFTYHVIIPTLVTYMDRNYKKVRKAIFIGTCIPLGAYLLWQVAILGIIPIDGPNGLLEASVRGENAVTPLQHFVQSKSVVSIGRAFAFFAMTASYVALALAFFDFLADGLSLKKKGGQKILLCLLLFIPPLIISLINPNIFITALGYAGGISCAILFGLYPPLMVWIGRYKKGHTTGRQIKWGKPFLFLLIVLIFIELGLEVFGHLL